MSNPKTSSGFTLIEVMIAMTLLGIMMVLLFSSMKICADSWQKGEDKISEVNDVAVVYQFFQHHLSTAKPLWNDFADENEEYSFQGSKQEVQFVSSFPASAKKSGLQLFKVKMLHEGDNQYLQVSITPFFPAAEGEEWHKEEVTLLQHVSNFTLNYYFQDDSQPEGIWQEDWLGQDALPKLVKIKIERDDGSFWPEMTFALKNEAGFNDQNDQLFSEDDQSQDDSDVIEEQ